MISILSSVPPFSCHPTPTFYFYSFSLTQLASLPPFPLSLSPFLLSISYQFALVPSQFSPRSIPFPRPHVVPSSLNSSTSPLFSPPSRFPPSTLLFFLPFHHNSVHEGFLSPTVLKCSTDHVIPLNPFLLVLLHRLSPIRF